VLPAVRPCHSPIDSVAVQAGRRAMQRAFGREVLFTKEGGSGPEATWPRSWTRRWCSSRSASTRTGSTRRMRARTISLLLRGAETSAYLWDELAAADLR
jgi:hypothetical protein